MKFLINSGVDGVIVQDLGLLDAVRKMNDDFEEALKLSKALESFGIQVKYEDTLFMDSDDYSKLTFVFDKC